MKSWLISVAVLFVIAKTLLWIKGFILPVPVYVLAGAFLAIASNYDKGVKTLFRPAINQQHEAIEQTASLIKKVDLLKSSRE